MERSITTIAAQTSMRLEMLLHLGSPLTEDQNHAAMSLVYLESSIKIKMLLLLKEELDYNLTSGQFD